MKKTFTVCAVFILILSCTSTPKVKDYSLEDMGKYFGFHVAETSSGQKMIDVKRAEPWSPDKSLLKKIKREPEAKWPQIVFSHYCRDGRQLRPLSVKIRGIVSTGGEGNALDQEQAARLKARSSVEKYAREFFRIFDDNPRGPQLIRNSIDLNRWEKNEYTETTIYQDRATVYGIGATSTSEYVSAASKVDVRCGSTACGSLTLFDFPDSEQLILSVVGAPQYVWVNPQTSFGKPYIERSYEKTGRSKGDIFARVSKDYVEVFQKPDRYEKIRPLIHLYPLEMHVFTKHFTILIPEEVQNQLFMKESSRFDFFLIRTEGKVSGFSTVEAIENRKLLWEAYTARLTQIRNAAMRSNIIDFNVSLDLNVFCKYGRSIEDLLSTHL